MFQLERFDEIHLLIFDVNFFFGNHRIRFIAFYSSKRPNVFTLRSRFLHVWIIAHVRNKRHVYTQRNKYQHVMCVRNTRSPCSKIFQMFSKFSECASIVRRRSRIDPLYSSGSFSNIFCSILKSHSWKKKKNSPERFSVYKL